MHSIYNYIALAYKAKKLIVGTDEIIGTMRGCSNLLVLISSKASINTFKLIQNKSEYYGAKVVVLDDIHDNLGKIFSGKQIKVMAIKDNGFKKLLYKNIKE